MLQSAPAVHRRVACTPASFFLEAFTMDASPAPLPHVNLVVRNVYSPSQSLALTIDPKTLVSELKRRLSVEFVSAPAISDQKLIFGGKICRDDEPLEVLLSKLQEKDPKDGENREEPVVIHLLVSSTRGVELNALSQHDAMAQDSPRPTVGAVQHSPLSNLQPEDPVLLQHPHLMNPQTQQHQNYFRQSVLMQQQAMVLHQIQYLQMMLMQQQQAAPMPNAQQNLFGAQHAALYGNFYGMMHQQMLHARPAVATHATAQVPAAPASALNQASAMEAPVEAPACSMLTEIVREVFRLLDFRVAFKMALMLLIIGQDTPIDRIAMLVLLSIISYLHITGIFAKIYEVYNRRRGANDSANLNGAVAAAGAAIVTQYGDLTRILQISADGGLACDIKYFLAGFFLSLVPAWRPQPIHGAVPVVDNAIPNDVPLQGI
ncbi:hypothetical protein CCR75_005655 [Bremia lactucae]|uniref:Ubiquitin-like domain-containing protein n=1 Tax=Bremia lactucae TaxID=4779 RepID=A0A976FNA4_BRELC|nr:hypothetical protein CCR75_005655 [Bremia lactucae]